MSMKVFNQFNESWCWLIDVAYVLEKLEKECQNEESRNTIKEKIEQLKEAKNGILNLQKEEEERIRRKSVRKNTITLYRLKEILNLVTQVKCLLQQIADTVEGHTVHWGVQQINKAEKELISIEKQIQQEEEERRKQEFPKLNAEWIKIQEKFRAMGHPDWLPEEEQKKKKKGFLRRASQKQTATKIMELNQNWENIKESFRALGHPEWLPEEEQKKKKKKKGFLRRVTGWLQKWTR